MRLRLCFGPLFALTCVLLGLFAPLSTTAATTNPSRGAPITHSAPHAATQSLAATAPASTTPAVTATASLTADTGTALPALTPPTATVTDTSTVTPGASSTDASTPTPSATSSSPLTPTATASISASTPAATASPTPSPTQTSTPPSAANAALLTAPLAFEANQGQSDPTVRFLARTPQYALFLTASDATFVLAPAQAPTPPPSISLTPAVSPTQVLTQTLPVLRLHYVGANAAPQITGQDQLPGTVNYLLGADPAAWTTNVPTYGRVTYQGLYPGIDLAYYGHGSQLEDDFTVAPGADPSQIAFTISGTLGLSLDGAGNLLIATTAGTLEEQAPAAYQTIDGQRHDVSVRYSLSAAGQAGFSLGNYDTSQPLVIDPVLSYSTYLGGSGDDYAYGITTDSSGNVYVTGGAVNTNFPAALAPSVTVTATSCGSGQDVFVTKLHPASGGAAALVYTTFIGGTQNASWGQSIRLDGSGHPDIVGYTCADDYPTKNPYQGSLGGSGAINALFTQLSTDGSQLVYSTYLGGHYQDFGYGLAVDGSGHAYLTGATISSDFPTKNALQNSFGGGTCASGQPCNDAFVAELDPSQSGSASLLYSSYLGGSGNDVGEKIALDSSNDIYVTGSTSSTNFLTTAGVVQSSLDGGTCAGPANCPDDAFVTKLNPAGSAALYSTYLGGSSNDVSYGLALDGSGNAYLAGLTQSSDYPTTSGAYDRGYGGGSCGTVPPACDDAFVTKLNASGTAVSWSTYLGGSGGDDAYDLARGPDGTLYVTGATSSLNFPLADEVQGANGATTCLGYYCQDAFVTALASTGSTLRYSTYLGGDGFDNGYAIALDGSGTAYVAGVTDSPTFPVTPNALQSSYQGGRADGFVAAFQATGSGTTPWHPQRGMRLSGGLSARVDLADGHVDIQAADLSLPGRGPNLTLTHTWDSALAQAGITSTAGQGWQTSLTPHMSGILTGTVRYQDASGRVWPFDFTGPYTATQPYTTYRTEPGLPWQLSASTGGYTLTSILSGETLTFDAQGNYLKDADAYGNSNALTYSGGLPTRETNSGTRYLALFYSHGLLDDVQSPLFQSSGGSQGQQVADGYNAGGQLTTWVRGYGSSDAVTTTFGYSGTQLTTITPPSGRTWLLGYDSQGRLSYMTSPVSGTVGQAGYTPAYTTLFIYNPGQTLVVDGYNAPGQLTTAYTLDSQGEATAVTDGLGHSTVSLYDFDHDVLYRQDGDGNVTTNYYRYVGPTASTGLITETVQPAIQPYSSLNPTTVQPTTRYTYSATTNDLIEIAQPAGGRTLLGYDGHHGVITTTQLLTGTTVWRGTITQRDQYGEVTGTVDGRGVSVNASGVAALAGNASQYTQHTSYTTQGDVQSQSSAPITTTLNGTLLVATPVTTTYGYDGDGNQTGQVSPNGQVSGSGYDHLGRLVTSALPQVTLYTGQRVYPTESTSYDADGNPVLQIDGNGDATQSSYDPLGRLVAATNPISGTTVYTYSATEQTAVQDPLGNVTTDQYDAAGRLITETAPISGTTLYQYDNAGNTTVITQEDSTTGAPIQIDTRGYDALNRVITDTLSGPSSAPVTTTTRFDLDGNVYQVDQPTGAATVNTYDLADQLVSTENDGQPVLTATHSNQAVFSYDAAGNAIASVDQAGNTTTTAFDGDNRVQQSVAVTGSQTITTTDQYDPDATAITQTTQTYTGTGGIQTHVVTATVNAADWQIASGQDGVPTSYGYDAAGQVRTQTVLTGTVPITMTLDAEGRETALAAGIPGTPVYTDTTAYNANDLPVTLTLNSGASQVQEVAGYDPNSRLTTWHDPGPGQDVTYGYGYDAANRVTSFTAVSGTDTITHDPATGWLTSDCGPQSVVQTTHCYAWSYDSNGNITRAIDDTGVTQYFTYSVSQPNELAQSSAAGYPDVAYSYDGAGNTTLISTTSIASGNPLQIHTQLGYDPQGRISSVTDINGTVARIGYNAAGERNSYTVSNSSGQQLYSAQFSYQSGQLEQASVVSATAGGGSVSYLDTYLYTQDGTPLRFTRQQNGASNTYWYETDGRGDVVAVTDNTGAVVDSYEYDLWGEFLPGTTHEKVIQPLKYAGYWYDPAVTWYWVDGRYYDPELERYLQPDGSANRSYVYAGDDPVDGVGLNKTLATAAGLAPGLRGASRVDFGAMTTQPGSTSSTLLSLGRLSSLLSVATPSEYTPARRAPLWIAVSTGDIGLAQFTIRDFKRGNALFSAYLTTVNGDNFFLVSWSIVWFNLRTHGEGLVASDSGTGLPETAPESQNWVKKQIVHSDWGTVVGVFRWEALLTNGIFVDYSYGPALVVQRAISR